MVYQKCRGIINVREWTVKNRQSTDTANSGHTRRRMKTNKVKGTTQHRKLKRWATRTLHKTGGEPRCSL